KFDTEMYGITDDQEFVFDLLREQKLLVTAGTGFNWDKPDHLRIVYLARTETLEDAVTRLETFLKERRR
ncbi:MAG: aminotransferase, partial [Clostridia bacterium]|nr:aminotransferase [Clostridia bacterium]